MANGIPESELQAIVAIIARHPEGVAMQAISTALNNGTPRRTLQYRLNHLVKKGRLVKTGEKRGVLYLAPTQALSVGSVVIREPGATYQCPSEGEIPLSPEGKKVQAYVCQALSARKPVGYDHAFLDTYRPNESRYLTLEESAYLKHIGAPTQTEQPAGTYARQLLSRLLIDLSWNSSRLEGNTYSLLDTRRLIDFGEAAGGKRHLESQMILNHKYAIEFLVDSAEALDFNRHIVLNLHALLADNLLADPSANGRVRSIEVGIAQSTFIPLAVSQLVDDYFNQVLATAAAINDPFEQAFFVMVHLPYLQPFDDVNKRVSRLAANIPLIRENLTPLAFTDVPTQLYTEAILGVYELNNIALLKDIFLWSYERSVDRYTAVRQSLGQPDAFRLTHHEALRQVIKEVLLGAMNKREAYAYIRQWAEQKMQAQDQERFREMTESELLSLHEGNFARYQIKPSEFNAWQCVWRAE